MKTNVRENSRNAYREIQANLNRNHRRILNAIINLRNPTRHEIAEYLRMETSSVAGRVFELMHRKDKLTGKEFAVIAEGETRPCKVGKRPAATLYIIGEPVNESPEVIVEPTGQTCLTL